MREIKFRAWWKHRDGSAHELDENIKERPIEDLNAEHLIIEQYTGLTDKNGTEIYEGDILHDKEQADFICQVIWDSEQAQFYCNSPYGYSIITEWLDGEIIGNIHENLELLEVKK